MLRKWSLSNIESYSSNLYGPESKETSNPENLKLYLLFTSPVRKYRKSYCNHPGVGVGVRVRVAQMLKFFIKVFRSLYLMNM